MFNESETFYFLGFVNLQELKSETFLRMRKLYYWEVDYVGFTKVMEILGGRTP